jgi:hypothetical protein
MGGLFLTAGADGYFNIFVVFPQPDGPTSAVNEPSSKPSVTLRTASTVPKAHETPSRRIDDCESGVLVAAVGIIRSGSGDSVV